MTNSTVPAPRGFAVHTAHVGIREGDRDDLTIVFSTVPAAVSAVFTRSRFVGPSVTLSRSAAADGHARGVVVVAGNANVATGAQGLENARELRSLAAKAIGAAEEELLVASTGVIGRQYPMDGLRKHLTAVAAPPADRGFVRAARAIMTTDTREKIAVRRIGDATLVGIAKGVGMIEPDMATLLTYFATDARLAPGEQDRLFRRVMDRTFNALSIDTDTSTSDSAALFANGLAGEVDADEFERALASVALELVKEITRDGEGATKTITVEVSGARDVDQAKRVGKAVVNSPLVKTAVHGGDPNWGRVAMAVGKCSDDTDIDQDAVTIRFGDTVVYPPAGTPVDQNDDRARELVAEHLAQDEVVVGVDLDIADGAFTVYGCDLTTDYVRLNAHYTT